MTTALTTATAAKDIHHVIGQQVRAFHSGTVISGIIIEAREDIVASRIGGDGRSIHYRLLLADNRPKWLDQLVWVGDWAVPRCQCGSYDRIEEGRCWNCRSLNSLSQTMVKIFSVIGKK